MGLLGGYSAAIRGYSAAIVAAIRGCI